MFTAPSITLACVWPIVEPSRSLVFVVVPTDGGNQFALEGPDPANQNAWTREPLTREQIKSANAFLVTRNPKANADLFALSLYAETWRFVWAVARHDSEEGSADRTHHATLASARRRFENLESAIRHNLEHHGPLSYRDVVTSVHRVEN